MPHDSTAWCRRLRNTGPMTLARLPLMIACGLCVGATAVQAQPRIYASSPCTQSVVVADTATGSLVTTIAVDEGPFGIQVMPDGTRTYVVSQGTHRVLGISTATHAVIASIPVDFTPTPLAISRDGSRLYMNRTGIIGEQLV
jgi:YVTN family beta-propeller protein